MSDYKPGDTILIRVGTSVVQTFIDKNGVQRLPTNPIYGAWIDGTTAAYNRYIRKVRPEDRDDALTFGLNEMNVLYHQGKFTFEEWLEFYLNMGYSVGGFCDLSAFQHLPIVNPVWGDNPADVLLPV